VDEACFFIKKYIISHDLDMAIFLITHNAHTWRAPNETMASSDEELSKPTASSTSSTSARHKRKLELDEPKEKLADVENGRKPCKALSPTPSNQRNRSASSLLFTSLPRVPDLQLLYEKPELSWDVIGDYVWRPKAWLHNFNQFVALRQFDRVGCARCMVQASTIAACNDGYYQLSDGSQVVLSKNDMVSAVRGTRVYGDKHVYTHPLPPQSTGELQSNYIVGNLDCIDAGLWLQRRGFNVAVLNMANAKDPGGGWLRGCGAQEENIHRRTSLWQCLSDPDKIDSKRTWTYPLREFGGAYSPNVLVFRGGEDDGYPFLSECKKLSFVSVAAYNRPKTEPITTGAYAGYLKLRDDFADGTRRKIRAILNIAAENKHDAIVLSAFGCGAFGNPPFHMAQLFQEELLQVDGLFKQVVFAIFDDHNAHKSHNPHGNFAPFKEVFSKICPSSAATDAAAASKKGGHTRT